MDLYVVRHGETQWNREEVFRGRKDVLLNETGQKQARQAGLYFKDKPVRGIVSGPLSRTMETAKPIEKATGVTIQVMEAFTDMSFGIWEGLSLRQVGDRYPVELATWRTTPEKLRVESGETLDMVRERVRSALEHVTAGTEDALVIVTHRVICKMIVLVCLNMGNDHFWDMRYDPGSITLLQRTGDAFTLIFSNETCHQREAYPASAYRDF